MKVENIVRIRHSLESRLEPVECLPEPQHPAGTARSG